MKTNPQIGRFGPMQDYRNHNVCLLWRGRELLGTIKDVYRDEVRGVHHAKVYHFNGDQWPIEPALVVLRII